jgi:hypothetical protein
MDAKWEAYFKEAFEDADPKPTRCGAKSDEDWTRKWAVFSRKDVEEAYDLPEKDDHKGWTALAESLTGWYRFYKGPGRAFGDDPSIRVSRTRVLVTHTTALDI